MVEIPDEIKQVVNKPGRIGTLSTADADGRPNVAYFGSPRFQDDGTFDMALGDNRTLHNLEVNPYAAFFCVEEGPVSFTTSGCRVYLKVKEIQTEGPLLEKKKAMITQNAGADAAAMIKAAVVFEVIELRGILAAP